MADFTDQDKELLDKLRKGFERDAKTRSELEPWQELIDRDATVNANRASAAAKIIEGFSGSWAAQYKFGMGSTINPTGNLVSEPVAGVDPQGPPVPIRSKISKLGYRGAPEINFVPYNWRTNTFGKKGPSLVGHPIGFEVIGPTLKSPFMDWTWQVSLGAGPNGGDLLIMDVRPDGNPNVMQPYSGNLLSAYGPGGGGGWTIGDPAEPNGGLYVVITDDGFNPGSIPAGRTPMPALDLNADTARFELFRVSAIPLVGIGLPFRIELHPDKRLQDYFDVSGAPTLSIRAITLLRPYVTRLQAIPQSGAAGGNDGMSTSGREQTFVVISPERAAGGDNFPPYDGGTPGDGTWLQGGFTSSRGGSFVVGGAPAAYGGRVRLPVPNPVREAAGTVESAFALGSSVGQWIIDITDPTTYTTGLFTSEYPIVNVSVTQRDDDLPGLSFGTIESCFGWFDMVDLLVGPDRLLLNRVPETDPQTGLTYWGPGPFVSNIFAGQEVGLLFNLHQSISSLWQNEFNLDNVESSRLKTLIDPQWVGRFEKQIADPLLTGGQPAPPPGSGPGRPDRAIFDTRSVAAGGPIRNIENPGNMMDLGFRMVLFPAKESPLDPTQTIPDFDRPITGRELVIDGSINEKQYVDIDYSSGVVRLSHPPPQSRANVPLAPSDVIPNGITGLTGNNPRGEVVLFAACVPYSMEDSQLGTGLRVTTHDADGLKDHDAYSEEVSAKIDLVNTTFVPTNPYIGVSALTGNVDIVLDRVWDGPETGVITIQTGSGQSAALGLWGYTTKVPVVLPGGGAGTALGGISAKANSVNPDPSLFPGAQSRFVVLRREVVFRRESFSIPFVSNFAPSDTYYGSSTRADTLRFEGARMRPEIDGSMTIRRLPDFGFQDRAYGRITPSKLLYPIGDVNLVDPFRNYYDEEGLLMNLDYQVPLGDPRGSKPGNWFTITPFGPSIPMSTDGGAGVDWQGWITTPGGIPAGDGQFHMRDNLRFVAKISTEYRVTTQSGKAFVGLVQDEGGAPFAPTVDFITQGPLGGAEPGLPLRYTVVGFQLDNAAGPNWRYWTRGLSGVENVVTTPASSNPVNLVSEAYYFVIEVQPYGPQNGPFSNIVKMGVFDQNKNLIDSINVTQGDLLPTPSGTGMFVCGGARRTATANPGIFDLNFHHVSVVLEKDLGTFNLPLLP